MATKRGTPKKLQLVDASEELTRKEELIQTAVDLFSERGFKGTSIRDIAESLGISVSNMYHYFENKEGLWLAILEYSVRGLPEKLEAVWRLDAGPVERLRVLLKTHLEASAFHQKESKIFMMDQDRLSQKGNAKNKAIQKKILDIYVRALEDLRKAGYLTTRHTKIMAFNVLGVINWYLRWYRPDGPLAPDEVYEEVANFVLFGILGKSKAETKRAKGTA